MTKQTRAGVSLSAGSILLGVVIGYVIANIEPPAQNNVMAGAAESASLLHTVAKTSQDETGPISPVKSLKDRDVYYPGSEDLAPDEMRIVACGTGMPNARPKQAASCFLVELGNGDKFLFDIGAGSHERIAAQKIPYDYIDKVFISHLHVDHFGDLANFWLGGTVTNRLTPLRVWGPSGEKNG